MIVEIDPEEEKELYEAVAKGFLKEWIPKLPKNPERQVKGSEYHPNQSLFNLIRPSPGLPSPTITQQGQQKGLSGVWHILQSYELARFSLYLIHIDAIFRLPCNQ